MRCARTIRAPASTTSTRRPCAAPSAARPSTTWRRCPRSSGSWNGRGPRRGTSAHDQRDAGQAGEYTGSTRPWSFGDEQSIDAAATVRNALLRGGLPAARQSPPGSEAHAPGVRLSVSDFEVAETERRTSAAVCLLVDLSYSMALRGTWGVAKQTALALHALIRRKHPHDSLHLLGPSHYPPHLPATDLAGLGWDMVQGTNLHHAL